MRRPSGELVGLNFYFHNRSGADALRDIVCHCLSNGGTFSGEIIVAESAGARNAQFSSVYSEPITEKMIAEEELMKQLESQNARVTTVGIWNAVGISDDVPEIVTLNGNSGSAPKGEGNPVAIIAEGWRFSTPGYDKERTDDELKCYLRFIKICKCLQPAYAAILHEDSLRSPFDLKNGRDAECFSKFFVSERALGSPLVSQIESMYQDSHIERFKEGLYVATWGFARESVRVSRPSVVERSKEVARMITRSIAG